MPTVFWKQLDGSNVRKELWDWDKTKCQRRGTDRSCNKRQKYMKIKILTNIGLGSYKTRKKQCGQEDLGSLLTGPMTHITLLTRGKEKYWKLCYPSFASPKSLFRPQLGLRETPPISHLSTEDQHCPWCNQWADSLTKVEGMQSCFFQTTAAASTIRYVCQISFEGLACS